MVSKRVSMIWCMVFFILMLLMSSNNNYNVFARKFLDVNTPLEDGFNLDQIGASSFFYKLEGELEKRFEDFLKATTSNDIPRGGNY